MSIKKNLGGDRLGSGKNMQVKMHGFNRSTHDLSRIWRSTMSAGTLVPYLVEYALPGDKFDIDLGADVKTYPTIGPLFGSFKLQLDVFQAPLRLYNAQLHNNALGIGMNMNKIKLPMIEFNITADNHQEEQFKKPFHGKHINASSIHAYLGIRGLGQTQSQANENIDVHFNGIPYLAYWDIYKNYYANKQEEIGMVIHGEQENLRGAHISNSMGAGESAEYIDGEWVFSNSGNEYISKIELDGKLDSLDNLERYTLADAKWVKLISFTLETNLLRVEYGTTSTRIFFNNGTVPSKGIQKIRLKQNTYTDSVILHSFPLENIDNMREKLLQQTKAAPHIINRVADAPYNLSLMRADKIVKNGGLLDTTASHFSQEGLGIKTYQSDIFNNWLSTEWIDGTNGINEITAVDTSSGSFNIDTLNLANKVYNMLNRIAISGGTYDDWIEANWAHESYRRTESPIYHGGLSKEVVFQEVVSQAASDTGDFEPLGTLAGKGGLTKKNKGGKVSIKVHEPSVIIGIVSLTPRIDYSQGNEWHVNLKTLDDFHKPGLDGIGFQELITEQMAEWDVYRNEQEAPIYKSAGKQPAWINYMTSYNRTYGNFADPDKEMYMTLNRRYEYDESGIKDLTSYIDPAKFNYLFAFSDLTAQNFWVQIGIDITARRKMSAKVMPNL